MELKLWECYFGPIGTRPTGHAIVISESKEKALESINEVHSPEMKMEDVVFYGHGLFEGCIPHVDLYDPNS